MVCVTIEERRAVASLLRSFSDNGLWGEFSDYCNCAGPARLADLIEPAPTSSDTVPTCDRDALLALAEDVDEAAAMATVMDASEGAKLLAELLLDIARRIHEACGEVEQ